MVFLGLGFLLPKPSTSTIALLALAFAWDVDLSLTELLERHTLILAKAAITWRLRRMDGVTLHPSLFNSPLIYDEQAGKLMRSLYPEYIRIARSARVPILLAAPTWRLDRERIGDAGVASTINRDAVAYMLQVMNHRLG